MTPFLDVQNLTKSFGSETLFKDISFSVGEGQKVGLIAKNGTGNQHAAKFFPIKKVMIMVKSFIVMILK